MLVFCDPLKLGAEGRGLALKFVGTKLSYFITKASLQFELDEININATQRLIL